LVEQLEHVRGKVEMGLRVIWDVANVFEYFVNLRPELRAARDTVGDIRQASRDQMIALGQLFEHALNEERDRLYEQVDAALEAHGIERRRGKTRNEREVMSVACLVERDALGDFDRVIGEIASGFDSNFTFDLNGPWAPASFTEVALEI
ncbi:MAG: GvpL/GvpF family gas vesicle protein, partial [Myxococcales bacterium]|nr:GvpL/GvpF family gas vesicle protein [Myxococcales bacterium]